MPAYVRTCARRKRHANAIERTLPHFATLAGSLPHFATVCHVCDNSKNRAARSQVPQRTTKCPKMCWHKSRFIGDA